MSDSFLQKPLGIASLIGAAIVGPYAYFGEKQTPPSKPAPSLSQDVPPGYWTSLQQSGGDPSVYPPNSLGMPGSNPVPAVTQVPDLREVLRFDIQPAWVPQHFPRVTTILAETRLDGLRVPFVSGTNPTDIAGSLTYYFDAVPSVRRIQFHGTTGDPSMLVALMVQYYRLQSEPSLGGSLFTTRWNNRITSVLQLTPAAVIHNHDLNSRYQVFLELNQPSNEYGLTSEAEQLLQNARIISRW